MFINIGVLWLRRRYGLEISQKKIQQQQQLKHNEPLDELGNPMHGNGPAVENQIRIHGHAIAYAFNNYPTSLCWAGRYK